MDGGDGGWPVLLAPTLSLRSGSFAIDEDQVSDSERGHTTEQVAWLLIEADNRQAPIANAGPDQTITEGQELTLNASLSRILMGPLQTMLGSMGRPPWVQRHP